VCSDEDQEGDEDEDQLRDEREIKVPRKDRHETLLETIGEEPANGRRFQISYLYYSRVSEEDGQIPSVCYYPAYPPELRALACLPARLEKKLEGYALTQCGR
jgi:hypothetical protein